MSRARLPCGWRHWGARGKGPLSGGKRVAAPLAGGALRGAAARADAHQIRRRAATQDEGAIVILVLTVATAVASLLAILALLGTSATGAPQRRPIDLALALVTIGLSWVFIHTIFAQLRPLGKSSRGIRADPAGPPTNVAVQ